MVICLIGLIIFPILGLFSLRYRELAKESFRCVFRMATFRPCESTLDQQIKSKITSKLMATSPGAAKIFYNNFKFLSWVLVVLFFFSTFGIVYGGYNYLSYGNCDGPNSNGYCIYKQVSEIVNPISPTEINVTGHPVRGNEKAATTIIEFACLQCPYSKEAEPTLKKFLADYSEKVNLAFFFFPLPQHKNGVIAAKAAYCADAQGKFWEYHDKLFESQSSLGNNVEESEAKANVVTLAKNLNLDTDEFEKCLTSEEAEKRISDDMKIGNSLGITGTPTFFIHKRLVGPQSYETLKGFVE